MARQSARFLTIPYPLSAVRFVLSERPQARRFHEAITPVAAVIGIAVDAEVRRVLRARGTLVGPETFEVTLHLRGQRRRAAHLHLDVGLEVVVADVAPGEIGGTERGDQSI